MAKKKIDLEDFVVIRYNNSKSKFLKHTTKDNYEKNKDQMSSVGMVRVDSKTELDFLCDFFNVKLPSDNTPPSKKEKQKPEKVKDNKAKEPKENAEPSVKTGEALQGE